MGKKCVLMIAVMISVILVGGAAGEAGDECEPTLFYIALRGGPGWADDSTRSPRSGQGAKMKFESEYDVNLAGGSRLFPWLRAEAELGLVNMSLDKLSLKKLGETAEASGHDRHFRGMLSLYLDGANSTAFTPFAGAGAGLIRANLDICWDLPSTAETVRADDWDWAFAWQAIAGVAWEISPSLELELSYRYYASNDRSHTNHSGARQADVVVDGTKASFVHAGLRYQF